MEAMIGMSTLLSRYHSLSLKVKFFRSNRFAHGSRLVGDIGLEGRNYLDENAVLVDSSLGFASYVARDSELIRTKVGKYCCIGPKVCVVEGKHPTSEFISIHPAFFSLQKQSGFTYVSQQMFDEYSYSDRDRRYFVEIGNDVWIGNGVRIMSGVSIGDGAVIGAGALVTKDVEPYSIVVGIPAKKVKMRLKETTVSFLERLQWWDRSEHWIKAHAQYFYNEDILIDKILEEEPNFWGP